MTTFYNSKKEKTALAFQWQNKPETRPTFRPVFCG
jgi:hypothetical protein